MRALLSSVLLVWIAAGCSSDPVDPPQDPPDAGVVTGEDGGSEDAGIEDAGLDAGSGEDAGTDPCGGCPGSQVCRFDTCIEPPAACSADSECQNDAYCEAGECIPYGVGPRGETNATCERVPAPGIFQPAIQCKWTGPEPADLFPQHRNVLSTPLVVDFDFDEDPAQVRPSLVFVSYNCTDSGCGNASGCYGVVRIVDGESCAPQHTFGGVQELLGAVTPAVGDLDGDGRPEVVVERQGGGVMAYGYDPGSATFESLFTAPSSFNSSGCHWASVSIHDLDDDGVPEIIQNGPSPAAYDNTGALIDGAAVSTSYRNMLHPVLGDLDGDGAVEMVDGRDVWRFNRTTRKWETVTGTQQALGHTALADFGTYATPVQDARAALDGEPEIAVVTQGEVRVQTVSGVVVFGPIPLPGGGAGGAPTVADFDGDGRVEVGAAGASAYTVFDPDCAAGADLSVCPSGRTDSVLWSQVTQDIGSNSTGSIAHDFDGDGRAEVVYSDECYARIYDGTNGDVLFSYPHTSCTFYENPVVADLDGDFRSELVFASNANCNITCPPQDPLHAGQRCETDADCPGAMPCGREQASDPFGYCRCQVDADCGSGSLGCVGGSGSSAGGVCVARHPGFPQAGVTVISDLIDRWVGSRPIWNQHAYAVTNVNDDGTVPRTSEWAANWSAPGLNHFRQNSKGAHLAGAVPDLTAGPKEAGQLGESVCVGADVRLEVRVCNRGTGPVAARVPVSFYDGGAGMGAPFCTVNTQGVLQPGSCEVVSCEWTGAPGEPREVRVQVDDDGTGQGGSHECDEANNTATLQYVPCP